MSNELAKVPFEGGEILCFRDKGEDYVVIKPLCEQIGVDVEGQRKRILTQAWGEELHLRKGG